MIKPSVWFFNKNSTKAVDDVLVGSRKVENSLIDKNHIILINLRNNVLCLTSPDFIIHHQRQFFFMFVYFYSTSSQLFTVPPAVIVVR